MAITQAQWEEASLLRARNTPALPPVKSIEESLERTRKLGIKPENGSTSSGPLVIVGCPGPKTDKSDEAK